MMRYCLYKDFNTGRIRIREKKSNLEIGCADSVFFSNATTSVDQTIRIRNLEENRHTHYACVECEINCVKNFVPMFNRKLELLGGMPDCDYQSVSVTYNPLLHSSFVERKTGNPCKDYYRGGYLSINYGLEFYQ